MIIYKTFKLDKDPMVLGIIPFNLLLLKFLFVYNII